MRKNSPSVVVSNVSFANIPHNYHKVHLNNFLNNDLRYSYYLNVINLYAWNYFQCDYHELKPVMAYLFASWASTALCFLNILTIPQYMLMNEQHWLTKKNFRNEKRLQRLKFCLCRRVQKLASTFLLCNEIVLMSIWE